MANVTKEQQLNYLVKYDGWTWEADSIYASGIIVGIFHHNPKCLNNSFIITKQEFLDKKRGSGSYSIKLPDWSVADPSGQSEKTEDNIQENQWFELGEFPPVGTVCEYSLNEGSTWFRCVIRYIVEDSGVVMYVPHLKREQFCYKKGKHNTIFRPVNEEKEKAIRELICLIMLHSSSSDNLAKAIYEAGFRKQKDNQ